MKTIENKKKLNFISWIRTFAVLCILACHLCNEAPIGAIRSLGQLFNIGVQIFLMISAFCFGYQGEITDIKQWYLKRIKRLIFPYELFFIALLIIYFLRNFKMLWTNWISCLVFAQGMQVGVLGADHTWFMTTLIICYLLTPFISKGWNKIHSKGKEKLTMGLLFVIPLGMAYGVPRYIFIITYHIFFYAMVYRIGSKWEDFKENKKWNILYFIILCVAFMTRIMGRVMFDGTDLYELIIVSYTQYIAAGCIFILFTNNFGNIKPVKVVQSMNKMSFEIYLCHYMFIVGPVSVMYITGNWILNSIIAITMAILAAILLHAVSEKLRYLIFG